MKNRRVNDHLLPISRVRPIRIFLLALLFSSAWGAATSQQKTITLEIRDATLEEVINDIRDQCDVQIVYNHEILKKYQSVTVKLDNESVEQALAIALEQTDLTYEWLNETIIVVPKPPSDTKNDYKQTIRGVLRDTDTKKPLIGATIVVFNSDPLIGSLTDIDGRFRLERVPIGRASLKISYVGYEPLTIPNLVVNSGKEVVLALEMRESVTKLDNLVITANEDKGEVLNEMTVVSARSISSDETKRYAGGFSDPSRILTNYAGVTNSQNGENDIIVRGNSPKYLQWRLEGMEISNPTHFADRNSIKGGLSAINNNLLATSDFYTGAFSPEFGNALSGVYDIRLRPGNNERREAALGIGLLGTEAMLEGPFSKNQPGSYLVNYRYSTVALINDIGLVDVEGALSYQDLTMKMVQPTKKFGTFSLFGLGGYSRFKLQDVTPDGLAIPGLTLTQTNIERDHNKRTFLGNLGLTHVIGLGENGFITSTVGYGINGADEEVFNSFISDIPEEGISDRVPDYNNHRNVGTWRMSSLYQLKLNAKNTFQVGSKFARIGNVYDESWLDTQGQRFVAFDFDENASTLRNFVSWKLRTTEDITLVSGIHHMHVLLNNKSAVEPRLGVKWQLAPEDAINFGYGKHSSMEKIHNYFARVVNGSGRVTVPNRDLDLLKAHHWVAGYERRFSEHILLKLEAYYQYLYDLPVENSDTSFYATINEDTDFRFTDLVNEGKGRNYGLELTLERFFHRGYYFLLNGSVFNSKYTALDGIERNTQFNGNYLVNALAGYEIEGLGKKDNQTLAINAKLLLAGGKRIVPLRRDSNGTINVDPSNHDLWDYSRAFKDKLDDIFQLNLSFSYKWNKLSATHELFLDLLNLTDNQARLFEFYDETAPGSIGYVRQFEFIPNLMYRVYL